MPANVRLPGLPPCSQELNPVEGLGERIKDAIGNRLWATLRSLEDAILDELAALRQDSASVSGMIHAWMRDQANASVRL